MILKSEHYKKINPELINLRKVKLNFVFIVFTISIFDKKNKTLKSY